MAKPYNEKSVALQVEQVLRFNTESKAHRTLDMPTWGLLFKALNANRDATQIRIYNLSQYLQSIQQK